MRKLLVFEQALIDYWVSFTQNAYAKTLQVNPNTVVIILHKTKCIVTTLCIFNIKYTQCY